MVVGIIGGSGLYNIEGLENKEEVVVATPLGNHQMPLLLVKLVR